MTNQEANKELERAFDVLDHTCHMDNRRKEAFNMARLALFAEPCEDCISRKALLEEIENGIKAGNYEEGYEEYPHINDMDDIIECIKYADSVQPKPKMGHWKFIFGGTKCCYSDVRAKCNICGHIRSRMDGDILNYCPNCGAKMESEDKE